MLYVYLDYVLFALLIVHVKSFQSTSFSETTLDDECQLESEDWAEDFPDGGPLLPCSSLNPNWFECEDVTSLVVDNSSKSVSICPYFGERNGIIARVNITCKVLSCIECSGSRQFLREVPCIKYNGYYYLTSLIYSIFLGFVAIDRFYLGYSAIAIGKLLTLGGFGVWWVADILLLLFGNLKPADDSDWNPWEPY